MTMWIKDRYNAIVKWFEDRNKRAVMLIHYDIITRKVTCDDWYGHKISSLCGPLTDALWSDIKKYSKTGKTFPYTRISVYNSVKQGHLAAMEPAHNYLASPSLLGTGQGFHSGSELNKIDWKLKEDLCLMPRTAPLTITTLKVRDMTKPENTSSTTEKENSTYVHPLELHPLRKTFLSQYPAGCYNDMKIWLSGYDTGIPKQTKELLTNQQIAPLLGCGTLVNGMIARLSSLGEDPSEPEGDNLPVCEIILRPISNLTKEEIITVRGILGISESVAVSKIISSNMGDIFPDNERDLYNLKLIEIFYLGHYLQSIHIDIHGWIEKGLAISSDKYPEAYPGAYRSADPDNNVKPG